LPEIVRLKKKYNATIYVDEAHGLGVFGRQGRGVCDHFGVTDAKAMLTSAAIKSNQKTYVLSLDAANGKIVLTDSDGVQSYINAAVLQGSMDDVDISADGTSITFTDRENSRNTTINFSTFMTAVNKANSNAISLAGDGKTTALTATLVVDPAAGNLLKVGVAGASVSQSDVLALLNTSTTASLSSSANSMSVTVNGKTSSANIINTNTLAADSATSTIKSTVNGVVASAAAVRLVDTNNNAIGVMLTGS
jgi:hypothetical protein